VSERSERSAEKVSMAKAGATARPTRPARPPRPDVPRVPPTRTIDLAALTAGLLVLALWVRGLGVLGDDAGLEQYANRLNAKADKPDKNFDAANYVHSLRLSAFVTAAILTFVLVLLVAAMRRTRSASASRWGVLIFLILLGVPYSIIPTWGFPFVAQAAGVVSGAAAIVMIVLVFLPPSSRYFRECRDAMTPPELRGQPRPGLGSLFKPRQPASGGPAGARAGATRAAATRPAKTSVSKAKAKAKVRSDAEAVAKGAELARTRAKSSKTRR
jgi:hypothetical protein